MVVLGFSGWLVVTWPLILQRHYAPALRAAELRPDPARLDAALAAEGELWVIASVKRYGIAMDDSGALAVWLARRCRRDASFERPRWDYRVYRVEVWRCAAGWAKRPWRSWRRSRTSRSW